MLCWSLQRGNFQMGLVERTPTQVELPTYKRQSEASAEGEWAKTVDLDDDRDPLDAAIGIVLGVALGGTTRAVIFWMLL